jgi:hypothetical protein
MASAVCTDAMPGAYGILKWQRQRVWTIQAQVDAGSVWTGGVRHSTLPRAHEALMTIE